MQQRLGRLSLSQADGGSRKLYAVFEVVSRDQRYNQVGKIK